MDNLQMIIGVDSGGTFTDFVVLDENGVHVRKYPSTPSNPENAILSGLREMTKHSIFKLIHGTTVATNALLEGKGAKTALITTKGCRDVLEIARQTRDELYSLCPVSRSPIVPARLRFEINERVDWQGNIIEQLSVSELDKLIAQLRTENVESVAICLLFSFLNSKHEDIIAAKLRESGFLVSVSSEICPEFREYERTSTVCANAFVLPVMQHYIERLTIGLDEIGCNDFSIMQSNGGTMLASEASRMAVKTALSGPAGGLVAARAISSKAGYNRIITFDMGGTSTDVSLIDGDLNSVRNGEIAGLPLMTPMMDIHTVGAGGGSIARIDPAGSLRVGPDSAGANPGPVAYGRGENLTVTDANILLGRLPASIEMGGRVTLDLQRVRETFKPFADQMGLSPLACAEGIVQVANAQMARALRHISVEQGHNPSEYALVSFGGAGGLHACELAEMLSMKTVLVPRYPGALSAIGLAIADVRRVYAVSYFSNADSDAETRVEDRFIKLVSLGRAELKAENISLKRQKITKSVDARYKGQSYTLTVPYHSNVAATVSRFHREHKSKFGHARKEYPVEITALSVTITGKQAHDLDIFKTTSPQCLSEPTGTATIIYRGSPWEASIFERDKIAHGQHISGPAIVCQSDATTFIPPNWQSHSDINDNMILTITPT